MTSASKNYSLSQIGNIISTDANGTITSLNTSTTGANLGAVGNVHITGGSNGQFLQTNGSGNLSWGNVATGGNASYITGQYELFANGAPDTTWLKSDLTYNSASYPALANIMAGYSATLSSSSSAFPWAVGCIGYGGGRYIAIENNVGGVSRTRYSTDGINWTNGGSLPTTTGGQWVVPPTWNGSVFFAVSYGTSSNLVAATSPDGVTWTQRTLPAPETGSGYFSCASNGSILAAAQYQSSTANGPTVAVSTDNGATWSKSNLPAGHTNDCIGGGGGKFIVPKYGSNTVAYSTDGLTWSLTGMAINGQWENAVWNGTYWLLGRNDAGTTATARSYDGINWINTNWTFTNISAYVQPLWTGSTWVLLNAASSAPNYPALIISGATTQGWSTSSISARTTSPRAIASDGAGSVVIYDTGDSKVYKYSIVRASTFTVSNPVTVVYSEWWVKS